MKAIVTTATGATGFRLAEVPDPSPTADQALVKVAATSLNRGDLFHATYLPAGTPRGYDFAGVVHTPAADGSGPPAGTSVVGLVSGGAWAEYVAVPTGQLAPIPAGVTAEQAAAVPVAGLTALYALQRAGWLLGRRVAITGAAGGVGQYAIQLASVGGARVTALVGSPERAAGLSELGATETATYDSLPGGEFDVVLESAGGSVFTDVIGRLSGDGKAVVYGNSARENFVLSAEAGLARSAISVSFLFTLYEIASRHSAVPDLDFLLGLVAAGQLDPRVTVVRPWAEFGPVIDDLQNRKIAGKAILTL